MQPGDASTSTELNPIQTLTTDFQTCTFTFTSGTSGYFAFHYRGPETIEVRNLRIYDTIPDVSLSAPLNVSGTVTCTSVVQTRDKRAKENIKPASLEALQAVFDATEVQTYTRCDGVEGPCVEFISNDVKAALPQDGSLDMITPFIANGLGSVDYARECVQCPGEQ
jgi:hypothetical protein